MRNIFFLLGLLLFSSTLFAAQDIDITAEEFEFDGIKNIVNAVGNVVVTQRGAVITSKRAVYEKDGKTISMYDGVTMKREGLILRCDTAIADGVEDVVTAIGAVTYAMGKIKGSAGRAVYDMNKGLITLTGNPVANQAGDFIKGETIIIDLVNNKVRTKGKANVKLSVEKL
jgi:lipopolysaccharide transport protein LptA